MIEPLLNGLAQNGILGILLAIAVAALWLGSKEVVKQFEKLIQRTDEMTKKAQEYAMKREESLLMELGRFNDSLQSLSQGFGSLATMMERNSCEIKEVRDEVQDVKMVLMNRNG